MSQNVSQCKTLAVEAAAVLPKGTILTGVNIFVAAATASLTLHDSATAANQIMFKYDLVFDADAIGKSMYFELPDIKAKVGVFSTLTGTGAVVILHYR